MKSSIKETFIKNYFGNGHNLFACVWKDKGFYYVQLGHITKKYKNVDTALAKYYDYLRLSRSPVGV